MPDWFGFQTTDGQGTSYADYLGAMPCVNNVGAGKLTKIAIRYVSTSGGNVRIGVYADSGGVPGARLLDAGVVALANGWVEISGLDLDVTNGTTYWIGGDADTNATIYQISTTNQRYVSWTYGALPNPFGSSTPYTGFEVRAWVETGGANTYAVSAADDGV